MRILDAAVRISHTFQVETQTKWATGVYEGRGTPRHLFGHIHGQMELEAWDDLQFR